MAESKRRDPVVLQNKLLVPRAALFAVMVENGENSGSFSVTPLFAAFG